MGEKRAGDLRPGDRFRWYRWRTVTMVSPTDRDRLGDGKGNGVYVMTGTGVPTKLCVDQMVEVEQ